MKHIDPVANPILSTALPDARNLLIAPMMVDGRPVGAIVIEHRSRTVFGVERRALRVGDHYVDEEHMVLHLGGRPYQS